MKKKQEEEINEIFHHTKTHYRTKIVKISNLYNLDALVLRVTNKKKKMALSLNEIQSKAFFIFI